MKTILLCSDGSKYAEAATRYAGSIAKAASASVKALHVLDVRLLEGPLLADLAGWIGAEAYMAQLPAFRKLLEEKGAAILTSAVSICREMGVPAETVLRTGHPVRVILDEARHADMVVLGQHGQHAEWGEDLTGSVMDRVTRRLKKPSLVTPGEYRPIHRLLVAYDGSEHAGQALASSAETAKGLGAALVIVTVMEHGRSRETAEAVLREGNEIARNNGIAAEQTLCLEGSAGSAILGVAREKQCDMLAVGAYGHSRLRELVLGSTTAHLLHNARIPILLVP